jgi:hypothetical protein
VTHQKVVKKQSNIHNNCLLLGNIFFEYFKGHYFVCGVLVYNVIMPLSQPLQRSIILELVVIVVFFFFVCIIQSIVLCIDDYGRTVAFLAACVISILVTQQCNYKPMVDLSNDQNSQKTCLNEAWGTIFFICIHVCIRDLLFRVVVFSMWLFVVVFILRPFVIIFPLRIFVFVVILPL